MKFVTLDLIEKTVKAIASKVAPKVHKHGDDDITDLAASKLTGTIAVERLPEEVRTYSGTAWESAWHKVLVSGTTPIFAGLYIDSQSTGSYIGPDRANNDRLFIRYRQSDGTFGYRSIEALVAAAEGGHNHDSRYYTEGEINSFLHNKLSLTGGTLTGAVMFANGVWNPVGDDCYMGDNDVAGCVAFKSMTSQLTGIALVGASSNVWGRLLIANNGGDMYLATNGTFYISNGGNNARAPINASAFVQSSSKRVKKNIEDMTEDEAKKLLDVEVKSYDYINPDMPDGCFGCIAEDIAKIIPSCVIGDVDCADDDVEAIQNIGIDYSKLVPHLIKMVQIQQEQINKLTEQLSK